MGYPYKGTIIFYILSFTLFIYICWILITTSIFCPFEPIHSPSSPTHPVNNINKLFNSKVRVGIPQYDCKDTVSLVVILHLPYVFLLKIQANGQISPVIVLPFLQCSWCPTWYLTFPSTPQYNSSLTRRITTASATPPATVCSSCDRAMNSVYQLLAVQLSSFPPLNMLHAGIDRWNASSVFQALWFEQVSGVHWTGAFRN